MGVADFPIELFRSVKHKHQNSFKKESSKDNNTRTSSGSDTPPPTSASTSQLDLDRVDEKLDPLSPATPTRGASGASEASSQYAPVSATSVKTPYESTERSSSDTRATDTPLTSTASLGSQGEHRGNSLRQALRGTLSRSRSNSRNRSQGTLARSNSTDRRPGSRSGSRTREVPVFDPSKLTLDNAVGAAKGAQRIVAAGMKSPMDFTLGLARGFHNAPKLYGDDTVRPQEKVTDFKSGLQAAGKVNISESSGGTFLTDSRSLGTVSTTVFLDSSPNHSVELRKKALLV